MYRLIEEYFVYNNYNEVDLNISELRAFEKGDTIYSVFNLLDKSITVEQFNNILNQLYMGFKNNGLFVRNHMMFICADDKEYIGQIVTGIRVLRKVEDTSVGNEFIGAFGDLQTSDINEVISIVDTSRNMLLLEDGIDEKWVDVLKDISDFINKVSAMYMAHSEASKPTTMKQEIISNLKYSTVWIAVINIVIFLAMLFSGMNIYDKIVENYANNYVRVLEHGEWYRVFTSMFLHSDADHLLGNMLCLCVVGIQVEKVLGRGKFLFTYFISGIIAGLSSLGYNMYLKENVLSLGASGAIYGLCGIFIVILIANKDVFGKGNAVRLIIYLALCGYAGLASNIDHAAHIGGLLAGILLGIITCVIPKVINRNKQEN